MAQVSSGSFNTTGYEGRNLKFSWSVDNTSIANNYKEIYWSITGDGGDSGLYYYSGNFKVVIDGDTVYSSETRIKLTKGKVVASGKKKLYHNNEGKKTFSASVEAGIYTVAVNCKGSGTWELPTIPRYATAVQSLSSKTETSITMNWSSDNTIDYLWYSKDNGSTWTGVDVSDGKSGSYTINSLKPNTTYNIKTRVRRKDSQLTTDSAALSVTTYAYPYCTSSPDFIIGNELKLEFYNPLSRPITIVGYKKENDAWLFEGTTSGTSASGFKDEYSIGEQYKSITDSKNGKYKVAVTYGGVTTTRDVGNTYSINESECIPTVGTLTYKDSNSKTTAITGNNQRIIRNNSNVLFTIGSASAKKSANISKYEITLNGVTKSRSSAGDLDFGTLNVGSNIKATLKVTDSRGLTASKEITITVDDWILPTAITTLQRKNNFYAETYVKADGSCSSLNGKNAITIQLQYKKTTDSNYSELQTIKDNVQTTLQLDNEYEWNIKVIVKDKIGTTTYNLTLSRGMPITYYDKIKSSVSVNCFPEHKNSFEIEGGIYQNGSIIVESGTNENGNYTKWADGTMICSKNISGIIPCTNQWNGWYETGLLDLGAFAMPFNAIPHVFVNNVASHQNQQMALIERVINKTKSLCGQATLIRPTSVESLTYSLDIMAYGRWK